MRLSRYCLPILRETKDSEVVSHRLMPWAGVLRQEAAGIDDLLPLGFRVLKRIEQIIREEPERADATVAPSGRSSSIVGPDGLAGGKVAIKPRVNVARDLISPTDAMARIAQ
jgi:hypothetical protein